MTPFFLVAGDQVVDRPDDAIVWVTQHTALNRRNITSVFHGKNGQIEVHLTGGEMRSFTEADLTSEGRELLCPAGRAPAREAARADE